jgi:hypothetical protein
MLRYERSRRKDNELPHLRMHRAQAHWMQQALEKTYRRARWQMCAPPIILVHKARLRV